MAMAIAACNTRTRPRLAEVNRDDLDFVDVTFKLSNPTALIKAHRLILAAASPYFKRLFKSEEGICPILEITNIDSDTFERLVTHCYTGKTLTTFDNVDKMLKASLILQLDDAVANCVDFLMKHITDYTLQRAYDLERETQCGILSQKIAEYDFMSIIESKTFLDFEAEKLQAFIESDQLNIRCEKDAFDVVKQWYEHDPPAREQKLPDLIACLRLTQFDTSFLMTNICSLPGCDNLALNALVWTMHPELRSLLILRYTERRKGQIMTSAEKSMMALCLESGTIFQYNKTDDFWQKWGDMNLEVRSFQAILMDECLILTGGVRADKVTNEVFSWSFKTKTFQQLPVMSQPRSSHSIVILKENIYVIGGRVGSEVLQSVEMYSVSHGWKPVSSMITPRDAHAAVAFNNKIYVMGGFDGCETLKSVECYDPITNSWSQCADMNEIQNDVVATVHNGSIFTVGHIYQDYLPVERYDPQLDKWIKVSHLFSDHIGIAAISYDNQLWAVGGYVSKCVLVYDERNYKWIKKAEIPACGLYYCFAAPTVLLKDNLLNLLSTMAMAIATEVNRDNQDFVDVTFKLSNPTALIKAHSLILAAASPYFRRLFKSEEGICPILEITNIDSDTFERLVTHCYTGKTLTSIDNVDKMLKASLILQLDDAVTNCVDFLMEHITDYTLQRAYDLERETQCGILSQKITEYETRNFMSIIESKTFLDFEAEKLQAIIESDQLNIRCEKDAFDVVKQWYEHDPSAREQKLPDLIACLRLTQFDTSFLMTNIYSLPGCDKLALKVITWTSLPSTRSQLTLKYTEKREESLMAFNLKSGSIFQYNKTDDLWQKWGDIKLDVMDYGAIFMNECLILTGGERGGQVTNEVRSWNFITKTFQQWPGMNEERKSHSIVTLKEKMYAIGGLMWKNYEGSVEMYSGFQGWAPVNKMTTPRYCHGAVAFNNKIYVMGGAKIFDVKSVECYDPITNSWTQCADMNQCHYNTGATVHNGSIFILGGWKTLSRTVERYDPQRDKWTEICSLSEGDCEIASISYDNKLWAVGGRNTKNVSVYDERNDQWIKKREIPANGPYFLFAIPKGLLKSE